MKAVAVLTVFWATAGEAMDRVGVGVVQCPQTLEGHTPTDRHYRMIESLGGSHQNKAAPFFVYLSF